MVGSTFTVAPMSMWLCLHLCDSKVGQFLKRSKSIYNSLKVSQWGGKKIPLTLCILHTISQAKNKKKPQALKSPSLQFISTMKASCDNNPGIKTWGKSSSCGRLKPDLSLHSHWAAAIVPKGLLYLLHIGFIHNQILFTFIDWLVPTKY